MAITSGGNRVIVKSREIPTRFKRKSMSRPSFAIWLISTIIAGVVILMEYLGVFVPVLTPIIGGRTFEALLIAYLLLWAGTAFKDI